MEVCQVASGPFGNLGHSGQAKQARDVDAQAASERRYNLGYFLYIIFVYLYIFVHILIYFGILLQYVGLFCYIFLYFAIFMYENNMGLSGSLPSGKWSIR